MAKEQYQTRVDDDIHEEVQAFKQERGIETDSEAIRRLISAGLDAQSGPVEAKLATDGSGYEKLTQLDERVNEIEEQEERQTRLGGGRNLVLIAGILYIAATVSNLLTGVLSIIVGLILFVPLAYDSVQHIWKAVSSDE